MSSGLYSGVSGLAIGAGLNKGVSGLWGGASGLITGFGSSFSPISLFAAGEQGYWLDPSDYTTMWQDSQGTTPVTATGQPCGLILDKSQSWNRNYPARFFPTLPIPYGSNKTAITAGLEVNAAISNAGVYYVKPSTGSDANPGTLAQPFATVARAMRTATGAASRVVLLEDAVIPPFDLRNTDASQTTQQFKWLDANGYNVIIRVTGPALNGQTWAQDATLTNCWTTTLSVGASQAVTRVLNTAVLDDYGYPTPLRQYASAAALNSATDAGYFWDNVGKVLWLNIGGNVEAQKANYRALYTDAAGTSRVFVQGSALGLSGVRMEGVQFSLLDGGGRRPEIWLDTVTQLWPFDKGADIRGWYVASNHFCYASQSDGCNAFTAWAGGKSFIQTVNSQYIRSGDVRTFAVNGTLQGVSAHGGAFHVSFGSQFIQNNGQGVGDTCVDSSTDYSWLRDCTVVGGAPGVTAANIEFGSAATSAARFAFLDNISSTSAPANGAFRVSTNGVVQRFGTLTGTVVNGPILVYGNHFLQSSLSNRPITGIEPFGGRRNVLTRTEEFDNAAWSKANTAVQTNLLVFSEQFDNVGWTKSAGGLGVAPVVTANAATAPDGTLTADRVQFSIPGNTTSVSDLSALVQIPAGSGTAVSGSVWMRSNTGTDQTVFLRAGDTFTAVTVTPTWQRFVTTQSTAASSNSFNIGLRGSVTPNVVSADVLVWGAQFVQGAAEGDYQQTTTAAAAVQYVAPDGTRTAERVTSNAVNSTILQSFVFAAATYRFSIWLRRVSGTGVVQGTTNNFTFTNFTLTSEWQRFSFSHTSIAGSNSFQIRFGSSGDVVEMWGAQLELGTVTTAYQRVTDQWNVTQAGVPSVSYISFDGTDDGLASAATINPGAVDKAQVFAGVRKLSDTNPAVLVEASVNANTNNGAFWLTAPANAAEASYNFLSRGTVGQQAPRVGFAAPITNVLTGIGDIAADTAILRVNGAQVASNTGDQGTGNYLTYTHFIGRRGGASLPFNGQLYSLIVRFGPNLTAATITQTETFTNSKTGAY